MSLHADLVGNEVLSAPGTGTTIQLGASATGFRSFLEAEGAGDVTNGQLLVPVTIASNFVDGIPTRRETATVTYNTGSPPTLTDRVTIRSNNFNNPIDAGSDCVVFWELIASNVATVSDVPYDATTWNGNTDVPTKNAVRDIVETLAGAIPAAYTDEQAQDAVGGIVGGSLVYDDGAPSLLLDGDNATPGNSKYYGTNGSGTKGFYSLPTGGGGSVEDLANDTGTTTGLDYGYKAGTVDYGGVPLLVDADVITLDDDTVNYVYFNAVDQAVEAAASFPGGSTVPMAIVTTATGAITDIADRRGFLFSAGDVAAQIFVEQASDPSTPGGGKVALFAREDGALYAKDDAGAVQFVTRGFQAVTSDSTTPLNLDMNYQVWRVTTDGVGTFQEVALNSLTAEAALETRTVVLTSRVHASDQLIISGGSPSAVTLDQDGQSATFQWTTGAWTLISGSYTEALNNGPAVLTRNGTGATSFVQDTGLLSLIQNVDVVTDPFSGAANVNVASTLYYNSGGGTFTIPALNPGGIPGGRKALIFVAPGAGTDTIGIPTTGILFSGAEPASIVLAVEGDFVLLEWTSAGHYSTDAKWNIIQSSAGVVTP